MKYLIQSTIALLLLLSVVLGKLYKVSTDSEKIKSRENIELRQQLDKINNLKDSLINNNRDLKQQLQEERMECMIRVDKAYKYMGTPYKWGGTSKSGVDCSGLVCLSANKKVSKKLFSLRTASNFFKNLKVSKRKKGALVFFGNRSVTHVGILVAKDKFIHASSRGVVVDNLSKYNNIKGYRKV